METTVKLDHSPVLGNVMEGGDIKLSYFPVPKWHPRDGGRYLVTGCAVITRGRDTGQVNLGTYRVMVVDDAPMTVMMEPRGMELDICTLGFATMRASPIAVVLGAELATFIAASLNIQSEPTRLGALGKDCGVIQAQ